MAGAILASSISGSLDAKNIVLGVLTRQLELSNLEALAIKAQVPELTGTIPVYVPGTADEDLGEWQTTEINGGTFAHVDFNLKKDRIKLAVSTEARHKSKAGDPLAIQKSSGAMSLAAKLDKKIAQALEVDPQTSAAGDSWVEPTHNPLADIATAVGNLRPWPADYIIMRSEVWAAYAANEYTAKYSVSAPQNVKGVIATVPGFNLPIYINDDITAKTVIVGCSAAPSVVLGQGPVEVSEEQVDTSGRIYQMDVFRQAKAPIMKDDAGKNVAAYQLSACLD